MQKNTSSTIIPVALLALLLWTLFSAEEAVGPRENNEETPSAKETPVVRKGERAPLEKPPEKDELKAPEKPSTKEPPQEPGKDPVAKVSPAPLAPPLVPKTPEEKAETPESRPPPAPVPEIVPVPKASVKGMVTDGEDKPIADVEVSLQAMVKIGKKKIKQRMKVVSSVLTDSRGAFEFLDIDPSPTAELLAYHLDYIEFQGKPFELGAGNALENLNIRLSKGGRIDISVLAPDGSPRAEEDLSIWRSVDDRKHPWKKIKTRKADSEGKSYFSGLSDDTYSLRAGGNRGTRHYTRLLRVTSARNLEQVIRLEPEKTISGTLRNSRDEAVEGALVKSFRTRPELGQDEKSSDRTNTEGQFNIGQLGDGAYLVTVQAKGYLKHSRMINSGEKVTLLLRQYGRISGQVLSLSSGRAIMESRVQLEPLENQKGRQDLRSNEKGFFRSNSLLPGSYLLKVTAPGHTPAALDLEVKDGQNLELIIELEIPSP